MKKIPFILGLIVFGLAFLWSCEKDDKMSNIPVELTLEEKMLSLFEGDNKTLKILTGNGKYKVQSSDVGVAKVSVNENLITINVLKSGKTVITLTDAQHKKTTVELTVSQAVNLSENEVGLGENSETMVTIADEGTFSVDVENEEIATATLEGKTIKITGKKAGKTVVSVTNTKINRSTKVDVTVYKTVSLEKNEVELRINEEEVIKLLTGEGPFNIETDNDGVKAFEEDKELKITALKPGKSVVSVIDTKTNQTATVEITVFKSIEVETDKVQMKKGEEKNIAISQGEGPYEVTSSNDVVRATVKDTNVKISALKGGKSIITVLDTKTNRTFAVEVVVNESLQLEKTDIELHPNAEHTILAISGVGPFMASSENTEIATATSNGKGIKISAKKTGRTQITVTDVKTQEKSVINVLVFTFVNLSQNKVVLKEKATTSVNITSEGNKFDISSDNQNVTVMMEGKTIKITGVKAGKSTITVTDAVSKKSTNLEVEVTALENIEVSKEAISLNIGEVTNVVITSGEGPFQLSVNNDFITATLENQNIRIEAKKGGKSEITISNPQTGKSVKISVISQYADFKLSTNEATLSVNQNQQVAITGGSGKFSATSNAESVATVNVSGTTLTINGASGGDAVITVTDTQSNKTKTINVKVKAATGKLDIVRKRVELIVGGFGDTQVISGMPVKEHCTSENPSIAVFDRVETNTFGETYAYIRGVGKGTTKVTISDGVTSFQVTAIVTKVPEFKLLKNIIDIKEGESSIGAGVQGSGNFSVSIQNSDLVTVSEPNNYGGGDTYFFDIEGKKAGTTQVTITDNVTKSSGVIQVTVREKYTDFQLSTSNVTLNENQNQQVTITGGSGEFTVTSNAESVATVNVSGTTLTINGVSEGDAVITVTDTQSNKNKTISVKVKKAEVLEIGRTKISVFVGKYGTTALLKGMPIKEHCVSEDPNIAVFDRVEESETIYIKAVNVGRTNVTISDGITSHQVDVEVKKLPDFNLDLTRLIMFKGENSSVEIQGSGDFEITVSEPGKINFTRTEELDVNGVIYLYITALELGETQVTIKDKHSGKSDVLTVKIIEDFD
ncbi:hypothetical protein [Capnocytophaga canis]|uniref:hypothetical protein n=1 Tax=Capnocytophaga canis TaxID=1848903 RepID=UPI0015622D22|nr:hypothetical protein [Capnocytophaga canis]